MSAAELQGAERTPQGVVMKGIPMEPVVEKCEGCERIKEFEGEKYCSTYPQPEKKWKLGVCNFATHVQAQLDKSGKVKVNPLKASKRAARGR
ncbi:hypothetical protein DPQ33_06235 [Oceanidesulfovibrio indonesiensis]|uniref:Uncharacterized protein n=1 Tax=Oceanidesulfovibrio indonesiensis TaxID=54767 RepID=A0A7M3MGA3_9BACT|nr:PxxKW family cysteine-rich protein [Oceanidesulfovibrio indonesiensis]TVM18348.1 hypothetical protein DPQ33_06235 [Oceanidesulfovibrio indonesiensis]